MTIIIPYGKKYRLSGKKKWENLKIALKERRVKIYDRLLGTGLGYVLPQVPTEYCDYTMHLDTWFIANKFKTFENREELRFYREWGHPDAFRKLAYIELKWPIKLEIQTLEPFRKRVEEN